MAFDIEGHLKRIDSKLTNLLQITKKETWVKVDVLQEMTMGFVKWLNKNKYQPIEGKWWDSIIGGRFYTEEQLYTKYFLSLSQ